MFLHYVNTLQDVPVVIYYLTIGHYSTAHCQGIIISLIASPILALLANTHADYPDPDKLKSGNKVKINRSN